MAESRAASSVVYFRAPIKPYPRSDRVIAYLREQGVEPRVIRGRELNSAKNLAWVARDAWDLLLASRRGSFVILAELQQKYALLAWAVARLRGATLVVDMFVGAEETVDDERPRERAAVRRRLARAFDTIALVTADWVLTDTDMRRDRLAARHRRSRKSEPRVLTLPVGAPAWARQATPVLETPPPLRVLYYGNYIPLHGVEHLLQGVGAATVSLHVTMVGKGRSRSDAETLAKSLGLQDVDFREPVPEADLVRLITECHVVAGIFGGSEKAGSVIANKVWQGLSAPRWVVTRTSPALEEIRHIAGEWLVAVPPCDGQAIGRAFDSIALGPRRGPADTGAELEAYVLERYRETFEAMGITRRT